jgi:hypothetical protein
MMIQMTDTRMKVCIRIYAYRELHSVAEEKPQEYFSDGRARRKMRKPSGPQDHLARQG